MSADDWELVRDVRLRALEDAPSAFGSRLQDERHRSEHHWREWIQRANAATLLAFDDGAAVGIVRTAIAEDDPDRAELLSMWVAPERRATGVGDALVDAVKDWCRARGVRTIELWVTETNEPARLLYQRHGFEPTDNWQPLPSDRSLDEVQMTARIDAG